MDLGLRLVALAVALVVALAPAGTAIAAAPVFRVVLDAGHGGNDPGAVSPHLPLREKDVTLRLALLTGAALQRRGVSVVYTRTDDRDVPLGERAALAQRVGAHALVSLHLNSAPNQQAGGAEAWYGDGPRDADLAAALLGEMAAPLRARGLSLRGTRSGPHLAVLQSPVPSALLEVGYVSNAQEAPLLAQEVFLGSIAEALAQGLIRFRDLPPPGRPTPAAVLSAMPSLYFVQPGDTLQSIAGRFAMVADELIRINALPDPRLLLPGQPLQIGTVQAGTAPTLVTPARTTPAGIGAAAPPRTTSLAGAATYTVAPGDTLYRIALESGVSIPELVRLNGLTDTTIIQAGQVLRLRAGATAPAITARGASTGAAGTYIVQPGDMLETIAARFGVSTQDLVRWNRLDDPNHIRAGQELRLGAATAGAGTQIGAPANAAPGTRYRVQSGDTLSEIAAKFHVSPEVLARANGVEHLDRIVAGTVLVIPGRQA